VRVGNMFLLAIVLPPVAVLLCGKPIQAVLNLFLTMCLWIPDVVHAFGVKLLSGEAKNGK